MFLTFPTKVVRTTPSTNQRTQIDDGYKCPAVLVLVPINSDRYTIFTSVALFLPPSLPLTPHGNASQKKRKSSPADRTPGKRGPDPEGGGGGHAGAAAGSESPGMDKTNSWYWRRMSRAADEATDGTRNEKVSSMNTIVYCSLLTTFCRTGSCK